MRVLLVTSEWPTVDLPHAVPFIVQEVKYLRKAGIDVTVFNFRGNKIPLNYCKHWLRLRNTLDFSKFDLIHAHFGQSGILALPAKIPLVVTFHGSDLQGITDAKGRYTVTGRVLRLVSQFISRRADGIILSSEHLKQFLSPKLPINIIPPGIDLGIFLPMSQREARQALGLPLGEHLVLFGADPSRTVKRYFLAEKAVGLIRDRFNVHLIPLSGINHNLVPLYMNACDVLVLTSKHEGSPTVIKEALACNLPVVSVDVGDVRQRLGNLSGCVLCREDSPEVIAKGLAEVLSKGNRIQGRQAVAELDLRFTTQKVISVYRSVLCH
jgi:glycosyltransferase involved in cell wall biosynthesis